jgi:hypothetical protein
MSDYRPDVTEALLAAGWTRTPSRGGLRNGNVLWRPTTQPGDSAVWMSSACIAEFSPSCPVIAVVATCLAVAGQSVERLADVIQLRPAEAATR